MTDDEARKLRESLGLTQAALASAIEVHPPFVGMRVGRFRHETISRYENGQQPIPQWYADVLLYLKKQGSLKGDRIVVTFPAVITKQHISDGGKIEW